MDFGHDWRGRDRANARKPLEGQVRTTERRPRTTSRALGDTKRGQRPPVAARVLEAGESRRPAALPVCRFTVRHPAFVERPVPDTPRPAIAPLPGVWPAAPVIQSAVPETVIAHERQHPR